MELKISKAQAQVKNVNLRTENNGDERVLAVDVKVVANVSAVEIAPLFQDTPQLLESLFDKGGNILNPLVEFVYRVPVENIELTIDDLKPFKGGRVKKNTRMIPRNGSRFEVTMSLQLNDVGDIRTLVKRLHEEVTISITERQQSLGLQSVA
ncbi:MAG: hypothetical protein E4G74_04280 [Erysipelotrichales bacterium]|nr:MAG: hypothetical protein E4G74_04280 [Erysipelotrichales bacterium]